MPLFPEFTIAAALVGILILYVLTRILNSRPGYLSRKEDILEKFQLLRSRSKVLQETLSQHLLSGTDGYEIISDGITYKEFLKQLHKNHKEHLADKNYARIKKTHNRVILMQARKMLEEQEILLTGAEAKLKDK